MHQVSFYITNIIKLLYCQKRASYFRITNKSNFCLRRERERGWMNGEETLPRINTVDTNINTLFMCIVNIVIWSLHVSSKKQALKYLYILKNYSSSCCWFMLISENVESLSLTRFIVRKCNYAYRAARHSKERFIYICTRNKKKVVYKIYEKVVNWIRSWPWMSNFFSTHWTY